MNIGEVNHSGFRAMSPRTKIKIDENLEAMMTMLNGLSSQQLTCSQVEQKIRLTLFDALSWTASDVLAQAVADGYKSSLPGAF